MQSSKNENARRNHYVRSVIRTVWNDMPVHNVWERYQFSLKKLEADCVREVRSGDGGGSSISWCDDDEDLEQFLSPSVSRIYAYIVQGRSRGIVWEPLIPVSDICNDGEESNSEINTRFRRDSRRLLEEELHFQFKRSFKRCLGGAIRKGKRISPSLSLDEVYSTITSYMESTEVDSSDVKSKKKKKRQRHVNDDTKEQFVLQHLLESHPFKKAMQKLQKRLNHLFDDSYSSFLKQLKKASDQSLQQQQQSARKKGRIAIPKISYDGHNSSSNNDDCERQASVTHGGISMRINEGHLEKLKSLFGTTLTRLGYTDNDYQYQQYFPQALFTLLLRYDALEGAGLQSAIPPNVFRWLHSRYGSIFECFASPFNCWIENQHGNSPYVGNYGSAFADTDSIFNSAGSFFDINFLAISKKNGGGCFQANPPFASSFIETMCSRMHHYLAPIEPASNDADQVPIMFIIFVPAWKESAGWKALESSPYLTTHVLLLQKEDEHYYSEGTQHRRKAGMSKRKEDKDNNPVRVASFDTSIFYLQNAAAKARWPLSDDDERNLKLAFAMKLGNDVVNVVGKRESQSEQPLVSDKPKSEAPARSTKRLKSDKKAKRNKGEPKAKPKLLTGGNDEMNILASLGLTCDADDGKYKNKKAKKGRGK